MNKKDLEELQKKWNTIVIVMVIIFSIFIMTVYLITDYDTVLVENESCYDVKVDAYCTSNCNYDTVCTITSKVQTKSIASQAYKFGILTNLIYFLSFGCLIFCFKYLVVGDNNG